MFCTFLEFLCKKHKNWSKQRKNYQFFISKSQWSFIRTSFIFTNRKIIFLIILIEWLYIFFNLSVQFQQYLQAYKMYICRFDVWTLHDINASSNKKQRNKCFISIHFPPISSQVLGVYESKTTRELTFIVIAADLIQSNLLLFKAPNRLIYIYMYFNSNIIDSLLLNSYISTPIELNASRYYSLLNNRISNIILVSSTDAVPARSKINSNICPNMYHYRITSMPFLYHPMTIRHSLVEARNPFWKYRTRIEEIVYRVTNSSSERRRIEFYHGIETAVALDVFIDEQWNTIERLNWKEKMWEAGLSRLKSCYY